MDGDTAMKFAVKNQHQDVVDLLEKAEEKG